MKQTIKAIFLLVALAGWMFSPPPKTVASQKQTTLPEANIEIKQEPYGPIKSNTIPNKPILVTKAKASVPASLSYSGRNCSKEEVQALILQCS